MSDSVADFLQRPLSEASHDRLLQCSNREISTVVTQRYLLHDREQLQRTHGWLHEFYVAAADPAGDRSWSCDSARVLAALPRHLLAAATAVDLIEASSMLLDATFVATKLRCTSAYDGNLRLDRLNVCDNIPVYSS
jgi:hypothetical protein